MGLQLVTRLDSRRKSDRQADSFLNLGQNKFWVFWEGVGGFELAQVFCFLFTFSSIEEGARKERNPLIQVICSLL